MNGKEGQKIGAGILATLIATTPVVAAIGETEIDRAKTPNPVVEVGVMPSQETEKTSKQLVVENVISFFNSASEFTDEEIKRKLMVYLTEEQKNKGMTSLDDIQDIGRFSLSNVQGTLLGYLETVDGENLLLFMGFKDINLERFVTAVRIPLYLVEDEKIPVKFSINVKDNLLFNHGQNSFLQVKERESILYALDECLNSNIVFGLYTKEITNKEIEEARRYGGSVLRYAGEMEDNIYYARSLQAEVFSNGIKLEYSDPGRKIWKVDKTQLVDQNLFKGLVDGNVDNVPTILNMIYFSGN